MLSYELCPVPVERAGLSAALKGLAARCQESYRGELTADCPDRLTIPPGVAAAMYRIAEKALDNAVRHSGARKIRLSLKASGGGARLEVRDDGRGFDVARARRRPAGLGLLLMEGYARQGGLKLALASAPDRDTIVRTVYRAETERTRKRNGRSGRAGAEQRPADNDM
jgi:signal transduction histidine kinase